MVVRVSLESEGILELLNCSLINSSKMKGILVTASVAIEKLSEMLNSVSVPVVIIGSSIPGVVCDRVSTANEEGAYKATMHLIRSGHENIAILCGSEDREFNHERIEGYKRALRDNQIPIQDQYIVDDLKGKVSVKIALDKLLNGVPDHRLFLWLIWIPYIMFIIIFLSMKLIVLRIFPLYALMISPGQP